MVFSSPVFLFLFLPVLLGVYFVSGRFKNIWLLLASLFFYSWGEPVYVFLIIGSIAFNFYFGLFLEKTERHRKLLFILCCVFNLGILVIFKYSGFLIENVNALSGLAWKVPNISLPIGISFYTFQILSYVIDVYRKEVPAQKNILSLGLYISLFPQLIAGPIVRYSDVEKQITDRTCSIEKTHAGILRFAIGFTKKILIADTVGVIADTVFGAQLLNSPYAWLGMVSYTIQIYFDFSGYSDMAIGLGKMIGFDFVENFNAPYISKSIQDFWRRWHISLSTWFRDYVYIPLGGSRKGTLATYRNTLIVFFLTGLWHGASWNFIVWGLYYAIFLLLERAFLKNLLQKTPTVFRHIYTMLVVMIGWVFFRADSLPHAIRFIKSLFSFSGASEIQLIDIANIGLWAILFGSLFSLPLYRLWTEKFKHRKWFPYVNDSIVFLFFLVSVIHLVGSGFSSFLYFRF